MIMQGKALTGLLAYAQNDRGCGKDIIQTARHSAAEGKLILRNFHKVRRHLCGGVLVKQTLK